MVGLILQRDPVILTESEIKEAIDEMKTFSLETIKSHGFNEIQKKREIVKLMLLEYYLDLFSKWKVEMVHHFLVQYVWEEERRIIRVAQTDDNGLSCPYGYEYNGQSPLFDPSLACDRIAFNILAAVTTSGGICVLQQDVRKVQLRTICYMFGRPIFFVSTGIQDNFREALVGAVITNTWIYISLDEQDEQSLPLLKTVTFFTFLAFFDIFDFFDFF